MTLIWWSHGGEGFVNSLERYFYSIGTSFVDTGSSARSTHAIRTQGGGIRRGLLTPSNTGGILTRYQNSGQTVIIVAAREGTGEHVSLRADSDGTLRLTRNGTNLDTTAAGAISPNEWHLFEMEWVINDSPNGQARVWMDGVLILEATGVDTRNGQTGVADNLGWGGSGTDGSRHFDLGIKDSLGQLVPAGNYRVEPSFAASNGQYSGHNPSAGLNSDNIQDEPDPDLTTYNSSSTPGTKDSFVHDGIVKRTNETVLGAKIIHVGFKNDSGSRDANIFFRSGGVDGAPDTSFASGGLAQLDPQVREGIYYNDPATGSPFVSSDAVNAGEIGYETV